MSIVLEKSRLNVWTLGGLVVAAVVNSFTVGVVYNTMTTNDAYFKIQISEISEQISSLPKLQFVLDRANEKIQDNRNMIDRSTVRTDEIVAQFAGKLDAMSSNITKMTIQLEVLATKINEKEKVQ